MILSTETLTNIRERAYNRWLRSPKTQARKKAESVGKFATRIARNEIAHENWRDRMNKIKGTATKPECEPMTHKEKIAFRKQRRMTKIATKKVVV